MPLLKGVHGVNLQNLRWPVVLVTMAVTLGLLMGAGLLLKNQTVEEPLKKLYAGSPSVESHTFDRQGERYEIKVKLKDVPDLAVVYRQLDEETGKVLRGLPYSLQVEDRRNGRLDETFRRVNLYVQEALATGQFATMADRAEGEAGKAGLTARVAVDSDRVFVQLHDNEWYLYSVVDRNAVSQKTTRVEGGFGL